MPIIKLCAVYLDELRPISGGKPVSVSWQGRAAAFRGSREISHSIII